MSVGDESSRGSTRRPVARLLGPYRVLIGAVALASFAAGLLEAGFLIVVTRGILAVADGEPTIAVGALGGSDHTVTIGQGVAISAAILGARFVVGLIAVQLQTSLFHRMLVSLRARLGDAYLGASWAVRERQARGSLQHVVLQLPATVVSLGYQFVQALVGALSLLALLAVAFAIEPLTALVVLAVVAVLGNALWPVRRAVRRRTRQALARQKTFAARIAEIDDLSLEIDALGVRDRASSVLRSAIVAEATSQRSVAFARDVVAPVYTFLAYGTVLLALLVLNHRGSSDLDGVGAIMLIMLRSLGYGQQVQHGSSALGQMVPVADQLDDSIAEFEASHTPDGTVELSSIGTIRFDGVSFAYPDQPPALRDVNLSISVGEIVGVVGASGAGKTTFLHLLLGLQTPTVGRVLVDGVDVADVARRSWSSLVAVVPQETRLLDGTLADNVRFWRDDVSDADVERALAQADLVLDPTRFPDGIHTDLGAAGRQSSGGQRQRIAIARALAARPSIVVLDEPTSSLDAESEEAITGTLDRLRGRVTVVVVSHRETTLAVCDRVLALADGHLTERR